MRLLLDTHIFLWLLTGDRRLPLPWVHEIRDPVNQVFLSVVSLWEALIKYQLGKLPLPEAPEIYIPRERRRHLIETLDVDEGSVVALATLPPLHRDPFDRLLIAQAIALGMTIVTVDHAIRAYPANCLPLPNP